ncbi:Hypothetical protein BRZCDTV_220 [Brazilian cedratvirus IHUMI]|uniref:Uncharacterized protein n=1 Tax=Brazilian cedratvirus IHUMI TaxID=2126980 RepID=A0A2R8FE10_9VIRU|nr:Hypothetical protein BRZCDTV_220 [Brazilian cedratvirus IHUMI]
MHRDLYLSVSFPLANHEGDVDLLEDLLYPDYYRVLENNSRLLPEDSFFFLLSPEKPIIIVHNTHAVFYYPLFTLSDDFTLDDVDDFYNMWLQERKGAVDCGQEPRCIY